MKPFATVTSVLFVVAIALVCVARPTITALQMSTVDDPDMYAVYNAVLQNHISVRQFKDLRATTLVISERTVTYPSCFPSGAKSPGSDWPEMEADYKQQNAVPRKLLQNRFKLELPVHIPSSVETFDGGWSTFLRKFAGAKGWIELSAVGFNKSRTYAFLYVAHHCGGLCGQGQYQFLEKKNGVWIPMTASIFLNTGCMWIS